MQLGAAALGVRLKGKKAMRENKAHRAQRAKGRRSPERRHQGGGAPAERPASRRKAAFLVI